LKELDEREGVDEENRGKETKWEELSSSNWTVSTASNFWNELQFFFPHQL
jgi:hypothetical protein